MSVSFERFDQDWILPHHSPLQFFPEIILISYLALFERVMERRDARLACRYVTLSQTLVSRTLLLMVGFVGTTTGDAFCGINNPSLDIRVRFCYGITAYCCGYHEDLCCWDSIWKIWWFWVVILVVLAALFSCIGYFCTCVNDDWNATGRVSPFYAIRDGFRRRFSTQSSVEEDPYKEYRDRTVLLPPYYPSTSTVPVVGTSTSSTYPEPPPPYTEDPTTAENTPLLPVSTITTVLTTASPTATTLSATRAVTAPPR